MQKKMQSDSSGENAERLHGTDTTTHGFPPHVLSILNPGKPIACTEILCRLLHVCLIETGFIPIITDDESDADDINEICETKMWESIPKFVTSLQQIIEKVGNLHSVNYKAVILNSVGNGLHTEEMDGTSNEPSQTTTSSNEKQKPTGGIPVTSKESGDGTVVIRTEMNRGEAEIDDEDENATGAANNVQQVELKKMYSDKISITIIHEGLAIFAVANGPRFNKSTQIVLPNYIRPRIEPFPMSAQIEEYYRLLSFSVAHFVDDMKRTFCYPIMDSINGMSYEIRSLCWFPAEIIVEIAKRCSSLQVFRLRATCWDIRTALDDTNQQFWKMMLKRDFPQYNMDNLKSDMTPDKFYKKYIEISNFTFRRPFRRVMGNSRIFPYYLLSNFRL